ncbi:hypothetical protein D3C77_330730 [compost metagenome]
MHQLQQLQAGIQPGLGRSRTHLKDIGELEHSVVVGSNGEFCKVAGDIQGFVAAVLHDFDGSVDQVGGRDIGVQQLIIIADLCVDLDRQLIQVFQQVDVGIGQALPTQRIQMYPGSQGVGQCIEQGGFLRVDRCQRGANP